MSEPLYSNEHSTNYATTHAPDAPVMSTSETLSNIFFEPARVFEALRERPRFLVAALLSVVAFMAFNSFYFQRLGFETIIRAETAANPRAASADPEQVERGIQFQLKPGFKAFRLLSPLLGFAIFFAVGGGLYLLGGIAAGGKLNYKQALSIWAYSGLPPILLMTVINFVLLFVAPPGDDMSIARGARRGLAHANLGVLTDASASPVLTTLLASFDIFTFYGIFLAAIGFRKVARLSSGAAWGVAIGLWLVGVMIKVGFAAILKTPMA